MLSVIDVIIKYCITENIILAALLYFNIYNSLHNAPLTQLYFSSVSDHL